MSAQGEWAQRVKADPQDAFVIALLFAGMCRHASIGPSQTLVLNGERVAYLTDSEYRLVTELLAAVKDDA